MYLAKSTDVNWRMRNEAQTINRERAIAETVRSLLTEHDNEFVYNTLFIKYLFKEVKAQGY